MEIHPYLAPLKHGLIVSCQALEDEPLHGAPFMAAMARAAWLGGAVGIRANSPSDISAVRQAVDLPVIGIYKQILPGYEPYITPTLMTALQVSDAGADIIALDATLRPHPEGRSAAELIAAVITTTAKPVVADIDTLESALAAAQAGATAVSTTLAGYTHASPRREGPDFELISALVERLEIPIFAEGRINTPEEALHALELGAFAVVVGGAITRPQLITRRFTSKIERFQSKEPQ
jgi:N-acylglucosamine-6-phosphate 2-epimerase